MSAPTCPPPPLQLAIDKSLDLSHIRFFVLDECDKMLEKMGEQPHHQQQRQHQHQEEQQQQQQR